MSTTTPTNRIHRLRVTDNTLDVIERALRALEEKHGSATGAGIEARFVLDLVRDWRGKPRADFPPTATGTGNELPMTIRWRDDDHQSPFLVCDECGEEVTEVEHRDELDVLVRMAREHVCNAPCAHCGSPKDSPDPTCPQCPETERVACYAGNCTYIADNEDDLEAHHREECAYATWLDRSDPEHLREVGRAHLEADLDHTPVADEHDTCTATVARLGPAPCGLEVTTDGTNRHGVSEPDEEAALPDLPYDVARRYAVDNPDNPDSLAP